MLTTAICRRRLHHDGELAHGRADQRSRFPVGGIVDPPTGGSASGCPAADYAGVSGKVALVQRGTCPFVTKWSLAQAAGATGVIIYNEGNTPARRIRSSSTTSPTRRRRSRP